MDLFSSLRISASGLSAQDVRMNTISSNIANAESVGYKKKDPVLQPSTDRSHFGEILQNELDENAQGVVVTEVAEDQTPPRLIYRPNHPMARPDGYVEMPNVNVVEETANLVAATRAYEANLSAINAAKAMMNKALEIGK
ncbi:MAG: flagellar basal body rod protein FlgC [Oligoflexia bacterium]|nr:flagellar basal body rod protein FlgC [Oligoflexia bacterium]